jgi:hypothetical protein
MAAICASDWLMGLPLVRRLDTILEKARAAALSKS